MSGKKRPASPVEDDIANLFDVEITDDVSKKLEEIGAEVLRADLISELAALKRLDPVYKKRREVVKTITRFWPVALVNHPEFAHHVQHTDDQKAIATLEDLWVERDPVEPRAFTLEFYFGENPYFSDKVLKKVYKFVPPPAAKDEKPDEDGIKPSMLDFDWTRDVEPQKTTIHWKSDAVNLTKLHPRVEEDDDVAEVGSFFNYFEHEDDPTDIGLVISQAISPDAINLYTGKAQLNLLDEDSEEEEEDEEDEAEEIDLEKPEPKKRRKI